MAPIPHETIERAVAIIGTTGITKDEIEAQVLALVSDAMAARRLIDFIPEAFGLVLLSHLPAKLQLPDSFHARDAGGEMQTFNLNAEPVFIAAVQIGQRIYHEGQAELFQNVSLRSSMVNSVNNALNAGSRLENLVMSGPAFLGIPAEVYPTPPKKSFWRRLFG